METCMLKWSTPYFIPSERTTKTFSMSPPVLRDYLPIKMLHCT